MKKLFVGLLASLALSSAFAQENPAMTQKLQKEFPNLNLEKAVFLPDVKLYELHIKGSYSLSYTDENANYFILAGQIVDPRKKVNVSAEREQIAVGSFFKDLPTKKAIVYKFGKGTRKVAIFTDPDCPFCRATDKDLHANLGTSDVTLYYYMNPLTGIQGHEDAAVRAAKIWCAPNPADAWKNWMLNNVMPTNDGTCSNPVADTTKIAQGIGFNSTPTMVFDNGFIYRGQISTQQVNAILAKKPAL